MKTKTIATLKKMTSIIVVTALLCSLFMYAGYPAAEAGYIDDLMLESSANFPNSIISERLAKALAEDNSESVVSTTNGNSDEKDKSPVETDDKGLIALPGYEPPFEVSNAAIDITDSIIDANFRAAIYKIIGKAEPAPILDTDVENITLLRIDNCGIKSLAGMEYFTNLITLYAPFNQLRVLPVLPEGLLDLYCGSNQLTELPELPSSIEYLCCEANMLKEMPRLPSNLLFFTCYDNELTTMPDLPSGLLLMLCHNNKLTKLPKLPKDMAFLYCYNNLMGSNPDKSVLGWQANFDEVGTVGDGSRFQYFFQAPITLTISKVTARAGDTIKVPVTAENFPLVAGIFFRVNYPSDELTLIDVSLPDNSEFKLTKYHGSNYINISLTPGLHTIDPNGIVAYLVFSIHKDTQAGTYDLKLSNLDATDEFDDTILYLGIDGSITVLRYMFGDFTNNGVVNAADVLWLQRYISCNNDLALMINEYPTQIDFCEPAGDFTYSGDINATDVLWMERYISCGYDIELMLLEYPENPGFSHVFIELSANNN